MYTTMTTTETIGVPLGQQEDQWFAVHTRSRFEKKVASELIGKGITTFLPLMNQLHRWSDRKKMVEVPLFTCYAFVKVPKTVEARLQVLKVPGVLGFVGANNQGLPIPEKQIDDLRILLSSNLPFTSQGFLKVGQRVRVKGGALDGVEGILTRCERGGKRLVISTDVVERSLSISIEGFEVEILQQPANA
jgi:transcription antitermination factor NusG